MDLDLSFRMDERRERKKRTNLVVYGIIELHKKRPKQKEEESS